MTLDGNRTSAKITCPLCKREVGLYPSGPDYNETHRVENHSWLNVAGDAAMQLLGATWEIQCPISGAPAQRSDRFDRKPKEP